MAFVSLSGVSYHIDKSLGNCTILPFKDQKFDADGQKRDNTTILRMKTPDELFRMDSAFKFFGQVSWNIYPIFKLKEEPPSCCG